MALESKVAQSVYENSVFVSWVKYTFKPEEQKLLVTENKNLLVDHKERPLTNLEHQNNMLWPWQK